MSLTVVKLVPCVRCNVMARDIDTVLGLCRRCAADELEQLRAEIDLRAEVERCRAEKQELIRRLEGLMDDWYDRRNEAHREAGPGPCTEASTLEDCAEELGAVLDEMEGKITPGA